jgi:hypothetical protein
MMTIALLGAGGKMGCRVTDHLKDNPAYRVLYVEVSERGRAALAQRGLSGTPQADAVKQADAVIFALPDRVLGKAAHAVVPIVRPGCIAITLDPAAAHAGDLPARSDITYFVTHPCHPSVFAHEENPEARDDFFGGVKAPMPIVCALAQGPEEHYAIAEKLARDFFAPVTRSHRVTVEQMAILEPTMAETITACLIGVIREAMDEAIRRGVPADAARDFMYGHIKVPLGIAFERVDFPFSDGAKLIMQYGRRRLLRPNWKDVFEPASVKEQVVAIVRGSLPEGS